MDLNQTIGQPKPVPRGRKGMVVASSQAFAIRAGVEMLRQGGNAIDAALTTALAQIALRASSVASYAGILNLVCYDATTGLVHALDAGFDVPREETDPLSIPRPPTPSGRTALIPGFMAGVEAAHARFGKLPFQCLFESAIYLAEEGFELDLVVPARIQYRNEVLSRRAETRAVFTKSDGEFYQQGDHFCQPELAETLR
jgi:gamma-glutamyltranspeptidase/glutathione hydrolase